ncbi:MAG TPA: portal protein [Clostridia bacterium]|nr:portal protein [Clostridia bacterium]
MAENYKDGVLNELNKREDFSQYRDLFGSPIQQETTGSDGARAEIDLLLKKIDRKLKRYSQSDTELIGRPDYSISPRELIPISLFGDDDGLNALGGASTRRMMQDLEKIEQEKTFRINRYKRLQKTLEAPEAEGILMVYADETTTEDINGEILHVLHPDKRVKETVIELFNRCNLYDRAWSIVYNMCGFGDEFYDVIPALSADRIAKIEWIPRDRIERVEENNVLIGFRAVDTATAEASDPTTVYSTYKYINTDNQEDEAYNSKKLIHPFRILHFKIPSEKYQPYGKSVLDAIVSPIEQLNMMIKALLIARVTRAPERRIFNIDVGNLQGEPAIKYAYDAVNFLKKKKQLDQVRGASTPDMVRDSFGATEDIVIPKRAGTEGNSIDTLPAANGLDQIADIEFLNNRIFPSTGVPKEYLYDTQFQFANTALSSKSVIFAKRVRRVQRFFLAQLYKLTAIELKLRGFSNEQIDDVTLMMNNPSNIDDKERNEVDTALWTLISSIKNVNTDGIFYPDYLIYRNYLQMDDEEIVELLKLAQLQAAGENIFKFLPEEERPEGAKDLGGTTPGEVSDNITMGGGMGEAQPGMEAENSEEGASPAVPQEVEQALGKAPENASITPDTNLKTQYTEAFDRKMALMRKFQEEQTAVLTSMAAAETERLYVRRTTGRSINVSYLEESGELDGLEILINMKNKKEETFLESEE